MKRSSKYLILPFIVLFSIVTRSQTSHEKRLLITEQSQNRIVIINVTSDSIEWQWKADSPVVQSAHIKWFNAPSDAKIVDSKRCVLMCASGGGVALIRIADKKVLFYAFAGGNTHSIELLPDGNVVSASSDGNNLTVFAVDTTQLLPLKSSKVYVPFGHNVVWDKKRKLLWSAGFNMVMKYEYNFTKKNPQLKLMDSVLYKRDQDEAHDMFPVYGEDALWLTDTKSVYIFDPVKGAAKLAQHIKIKHVKSISSGPPGYPTIISYPKQRWWTDEILGVDGKSIFRSEGWKIYKARWVLPNHFSY